MSRNTTHALFEIMVGYSSKSLSPFQGKCNMNIDVRLEIMG